MVLKEECTKTFLEAIVDINNSKMLYTEEIKKDALKMEKGSLDKDFRYQVMVVARSYLKLGEKLLDKDGALHLANYLYFEFEKPISEYLGFAMPKMLPY